MPAGTAAQPMTAVDKSESAGEGGGLSASPEAACREELNRVLQSQTFQKAPRLLSLLRYVAEKSLSGQTECLTEQQIGIHVFSRKPGYSSADDTIVRGSARHLRSRLEQYYREEGSHDPVRISIPKGGYVACFQAAAPYPDIPTPSALTYPPPPGYLDLPREDRAGRKPWPQSARWLVGLLLAVCLTLAGALWKERGATAGVARNQGPVLLWRALFQADRRTLIVPGDAALDSYIAWEDKPVPLSNYTNQSYQQQVTVSRPPKGMDVPLGVRSVTPMADLRMTAELVRIPERLGEPGLEGRVEIRYARDLTAADTRDANLILIGAETFNPWGTLYQPQLDFSIHWDPATDLYTVDDRAPRAGEPKQRTYRRGASGGTALALVAFEDNTQGQGNVLLIQGTSMGTTYSALTLLTSERLWLPVLREATDRNGHLRHFEVLLGNDFVRGGATNTRILSVHVH